MSTEEKVILAIRLRGQVSVRPQIEFTMDKLKLGRLHQARVLKMTPSLQGMITKSKDYITWGEITAETAEKLVTKRGRLPGNKRVTNAYVKANSKYSTIKAFAKALASGEASTADVEGLKPVFRLSPPTKGFKGKRNLPVGMGGVTGYRGTGINELAQKMI
ncbi:MAG: 50S ribosomal protein L30 [Candidatus Thorarchaeota archaeon]